MRVPGLYGLNQRLKPFRHRLRARWLTRQGRRQDAVVQLSRIVDGMFRRDEIRLLYQTARHAQGPGDVAEIGSWKGRTTVVLGLALQDAGADCRLYAIDPHEGTVTHQRAASTLETFRRNVRELGVADRVEEMVMRSDEAARVLAARGVRLRLLFIDGAHDEESVRADIRSFVPLVQPKGLVAFHDCEPEGKFPGVFRAYQAELAPRVDEIASSSSLLVTRLRA